MLPKRQIRSRQRLVAVPPLPLCCVLVLSLSWPSLSSAWLPSPTLTSSRHTIQHQQQQSVKVSLGLGVKKIEDDAAYDQSPDTTDADQSEHHRNMTRNVLKKVRVAKAQAEIDRILQGPDAPIDTEAEMEKVISLHHSPSEQPLLDAQMAQLESELYNAVKQQDFTMASHKQAELTQLQQDGTTAEAAAAAAAAQPLEPPPNGAQTETEDSHHHSSHLVDDGGAILQVNAAFYRAFSKKSLEDMERVWLRHDGDTSVCIHPSHKPLVGARRIAKSWKQMFASSDNSFQRNWMEPHKIRIQIKGAHMAIVTCEEHVFGRRFVRGRKRQTELINKLLATNIFRKVAGKWYMCYHHASWHPDSDAAKRALTGGSSGNTLVSSSSNNYHDQDGWDDDDGNNSNYPSSWKQRRRRRQREDDEDTVIGMDGILGNDFGPILGDGSDNGNNSNNGGQDGKPTKRIIMGASLSDILNGSLGDILGNDGGKSGSSSSSNNNDNTDLPQEGAIIRFARMGDDQDDDEDDDEIEIDEDELDLSEMDEIEVEEEEDDDDDEGESVAIIKEWAKSSAKRQSNNNNNKSDAEDVNGAESNVNGEGQRNGSKVFLSKEPSLRQRCIQALRKLCDQGSISPRQKRVLLTDIITCSSRGEDSMVEVAYDLLCGSSGIEQPHDSNEKDDEADDTAEKEFADQCRVFAQEHLQREETELLER